MVATANPASDQNPSRNRQHIPESGWDCGASPSGWGRHAPKPANEVITDSGAAEPAIPVIPDPLDPNVNRNPTPKIFLVREKQKQLQNRPTRRSPTRP
jgi:hypothetical protein